MLGLVLLDGKIGWRSQLYKVELIQFKINIIFKKKRNVMFKVYNYGSYLCCMDSYS